MEIVLIILFLIIVGAVCLEMYLDSKREPEPEPEPEPEKEPLRWTNHVPTWERHPDNNKKR